jgi:hypothetical protein
MLFYALPLAFALAGQTPQAPPKPVPVARAPSAPRPAPAIYNQTADAKAQVAAAISAADIDDIRVLITWGANDDAGSLAFARALATPQVRATRYASDEYRIVNVDVGHLDRNLDLARTYGASLATGALPGVTVLDQTGAVLANATSRDFAAVGDPAVVDPKAVAAFLVSHQAPAPETAAPLEAALKQAQREGKLVFVWFSAPW